MNPADTTFLLALLHSNPAASSSPPAAWTAWATAMSSADWSALLTQAHRHDVAALVFALCKEAKLLPQMPPAITQELQQVYARTVASNLKLYRQLGEVLTTLQDAGIPTILLKGAHLAQAVYGDIGLRSMSDLDLLVHEADLTRAHDLLLALGYQPPATVSSTFHHLPELSKPGAFTIDLHWTILPERGVIRVPMADFWQRAKPIAVKGHSALGLAPEDLLLHLILHTAVQHNFRFGLRALYDILATIRHYEAAVDWPQLVAQARQAQADRAVYLTLYLCKDLLGAPVPPEILSQLQPPSPTAQIIAQAKEAILEGSTEPMLLPHSLLHVWGEKRAMARLRALMDGIFLPSADMARLYHVTPGSLALYRAYLTRLHYVVKQHGNTVWHLLRRNPTLTPKVARQKSLLDWMLMA